MEPVLEQAVASLLNKLTSFGAEMADPAFQATLVAVQIAGAVDIGTGVFLLCTSVCAFSIA